jgi:hypothetical protein
MSNNFLAHIKKHGKEIDAEIAAVFKKYGIEITGRSARVDMADGEYKFKVRYATPEGEAGLKQKFETYAPMFDMDPSWFNKDFKMGGVVYTFVGFDLKKHKRPVLAKCQRDGKTYLLTPEQGKLYGNNFLVK